MHTKLRCAHSLFFKRSLHVLPLQCERYYNLLLTLSGQQLKLPFKNFQDSIWSRSSEMNTNLCVLSFGTIPMLLSKETFQADGPL